jgi:hypothetical protein
MIIQGHVKDKCMLSTVNFMNFKLNNQVLIHLDVDCYDVCIIIDAPLALWSSIESKNQFWLISQVNTIIWIRF